MRVAINPMVLEPSRPGGDKTYVMELVRRLPAIGPEDEWVVFATPGGSELLPVGLPNLRVVLCPVPGTSLVLRALWEQLFLPVWIARARPDLLHCPANVAPLRCQTPTILTLHEAEPFIPGAGIPLPLVAWWRALRGQSARRATTVLTVSEAAKADLVRWMGLAPHKVAVVHHGVDLSRFGPREFDAHQAPLSHPYVLSVGRPSPAKNLPRLIEAFSLLRQRGRQELLVLLGPRGWTESAVIEAIDKHKAADYVIRRASPTDNIARWYQAASAFVLPSVRESFGLALLEAMACGTPVVAGDIPALREVGSDAALYADPFRTYALANELHRALTDENANQAAAVRGPARAQQFSWQDAARQTYQWYQRSVDGGERVAA